MVLYDVIYEPDGDCHFGDGKERPPQVAEAKLKALSGELPGLDGEDETVPA